MADEDPIRLPPIVIGRGGLTWPQARGLARQGYPIRRIGWPVTKWLYWSATAYTWIVLESDVSDASPVRDSRRVVQAFDFGKSEFLSSDWTVDVGAGGDSPQTFEPGGSGPGAGVPSGPFESIASPDPAHLSLTVTTPDLPSGAVCLVAGGSTRLRVRADCVGGATGVGTLSLTVGADTFTIAAYAGFSVVHDFTVDFEPGDEFEVTGTFHPVTGANGTAAAAITLPGGCLTISIRFDGDMTETSSPPEEYDDEGYVRTESYVFYANYQCAGGAGTKTARFTGEYPGVDAGSTPLIGGTVTPPGTSYTRPVTAPPTISVTLNGSNTPIHPLSAALHEFGASVSSDHFVRTASEEIGSDLS